MAYLFNRVAEEDNAWCCSVVVSHDPSGVGAISVFVDRECPKPTSNHEEFVGKFLQDYVKLWPEIKKKIFEHNSELKSDADIIRLCEGINLYLPCKMEGSVKWSMQYSFTSETYGSYGVFIDFDDDKILAAYGAD
jgi:hypothetical protein